MAWSQSDVTALEGAIKTGVKRVTYHDHTAEYHSLTEMLQLLDRMRAEVRAASGTAGSAIFAGRIE
jgi:hypothetical protein